ncbi:hypothetical protein [Mycoplasmopsis agalactiae]|uniref:hypothetical protein n=1 Tax=Mycoplasmopsis agalactiae TaxID=2110 RepID=UPI001F45BF23|nr:hypothetical protein [Mycoplasmopsis agalactiae]
MNSTVFKSLSFISFKLAIVFKTARTSSFLTSFLANLFNWSLIPFSSLLKSTAVDVVVSEFVCIVNSYLPETSFDSFVASITSLPSLNSTVFKSLSFISFKLAIVFKTARTSSFLTSFLANLFNWSLIPFSSLLKSTAVDVVVSEFVCIVNSYLPETSFDSFVASITSLPSLNSTVFKSLSFISFKLAIVFKTARTSSS